MERQASIFTLIVKALFGRTFWPNPRTPPAPTKTSGHICLRERHLGSFPAVFVASRTSYCHGGVGLSPLMSVPTKTGIEGSNLDVILTLIKWFWFVNLT